MQSGIGRWWGFVVSVHLFRNELSRRLHAAFKQRFAFLRLCSVHQPERAGSSKLRPPSFPNSSTEQQLYKICESVADSTFALSFASPLVQTGNAVSLNSKELSNGGNAFTILTIRNQSDQGINLFLNSGSRSGNGGLKS